MNKEYISKLTQIYNTLLLVYTNGENTKIMGKCLDAFEILLIDLAKESQNKEE